MLINVRSICNKVYSLTELLIAQNIDICCLTETWLNDHNKPIVVNLKREGFDIISCPRTKNKRGGGLAFISKKKRYNTTIIKTVFFQTFEVLQVLLHGKIENIMVSTIYRTGYLDKNNKSLFFKELTDFLELILATDNLNLVWGDFNIRINNLDNLSSEFLDIFNSKGFIQHIDQPKHINGGLLDLVFLPLKNTIHNLDIVHI